MTSADVGARRVVTTTVFVFAPAATVTLEATVATPVFDEKSETTAPPAGAAPFKVRVAVEVPPATTLAGEKVTESAAGEGVMPRLADAVAPPYVAERLTGLALPAGSVVAVNVFAVAPAATVTLAGTETLDVLPLARLTIAPPLGAGPLSVSVAVVCAPLTRLAAARVTE